MTNDVYTIGSNCTTCARDSASPKSKRELQLFPASGLLEFVAIDILRSMPRAVNKNKYVVVMTTRYKLLRAMPSEMTLSSHLASVLFESGIVSYIMSVYNVTDHNRKFMSKMLVSLSTTLGLKHLTTTSCQHYTNGQIERYNRFIVTLRRYHVAKNEKSLDTYVQPLTYANIVEVQKFTNTTLFSFVLLLHPP